MNIAASRIAKKISQEYFKNNTEKQRFIVKALASSNRSASLSLNVIRPGYRNVILD
jgi:5-methyltetrahydrofolate--homocysteine methyltransferase